MVAFEHRLDVSGDHVIDVISTCGDILYSSDGHKSRVEAEQESVRWYEWFERAPPGAVESIYYILAVPLIWPGPPPDTHRYSGLQFKIGRTRNVLKRLQNLQTGSSDDFILHAIEPGDARLEAIRHDQFKSDRRQGEWFAASKPLCQHVLDTWKRNRLLPPDHQRKVLRFAERSDLYARLRQGGMSFDMINPSLNDEWSGSVFVDLVYTPLISPKERDQ